MPHPGAEKAAVGEAFWRFSLALYARPGVAEALIALQDRAALEVNLILFGLWLGASQGRRLTAEGLAAAEAAIAPIAGVVVAPLRRLRRQIKPAAESDLQALRRRVARLEIEAERRAQYRLAAQVADASGAPPKGDRLGVAHANLALILSGEAGSPEARVLSEALGALIRRP
jgi:uncharacterized protein (TIGR02444 family)